MESFRVLQPLNGLSAGLIKIPPFTIYSCLKVYFVESRYKFVCLNMFYLSYDLDMTFPYFVLGALSLRGYMFIKDIVN